MLQLHLSTHRKDFAVLHVDHKHRHTITKHEEDHSEKVMFDSDGKDSPKKARKTWGDQQKKSLKCNFLFIFIMLQKFLSEKLSFKIPRLITGLAFNIHELRCYYNDQ